jgi:hypothetical protein
MHQAQPLQLVLLQDTEPEPLPPDLVEDLVAALAELLIAEAARKVIADES